MMEVLLFFLILLPSVTLQYDRRALVQRFREEGYSRDIAIFVRNLSGEFTDAQYYTIWGVNRAFDCDIGRNGEEGLCYFRKASNTATGISAVITFELGFLTGSYAAVIFSVPYNRISACNWFGVHLVNTPLASKKMYDELYGKAYNYTHSTLPTWINVTDGSYYFNVTMSHSPICDMDISLTGKPGKDTGGTAVKPKSERMKILRIIKEFISHAKPVEPVFETTIGINLEIFNHNLGGPVKIDSHMTHGKRMNSTLVASVGGSAPWIFEKQSGAWYGSQGVLSLRTDEWDKSNGYATVWIFWYIPYSNLYSNYFGFGISANSSAKADGKSMDYDFYNRRTKGSSHTIYVPNAHRSFAMGFSNGAGPGYVIEGTFSSSKQSSVAINVMKLDEVFEAMKYRVDTARLHHFLYCPNNYGSCSVYHSRGVEALDMTHY